MYPMPEHLKEILAADESKCDENNVAGEIKCTCGSSKFMVDTFSSSYGDGLIGTEDYNGGSELVIKNTCSDCGKKYLIFDFAKHGYDGLICGDGRVLENESLMKKYLCPRCGGEHFRMNVVIETENKEQFIEEVLSEYPDQFTEKDYANIFDWFIANISCCKCGHKIEGWLDIELS